MSSDDSTALLEAAAASGEGDAARGRWWCWRFDAAEAKRQVQFALPMTLTNVFYYGITLVSVMFAGHLGELELAGATLANSWATVTGFAFMVDAITTLSSVSLFPFFFG